jgi:surface protein
MDAKFISINTKAGFEKNKSSIPQKSITFIKETAEIYADGNIYSSMSPVTETVTLTPGVTAKLGVFNGQTLNVKLNDEEQYSGSTDVSRIDPAQKCQTFYQSVDARIGFIYGNKTHGTYNIVIRAQENITIEVPRSENYIVAKYKFELTKNATLVLKMHIIDDGIVVSYDEYQGYEEIEDIVTLQNKTELPYSGGMITVSVNKIKTRVYDDGSIVELSNQVLGANSVVVTSYNYGLEDWQKTAVVNVGGEDITINYTQYAPHILAKYTITDDKYLVNNTDEIYKIVANGVDLGTNSEVAEPGEYTARIYLKNGTTSATYNFELMFASTPGLKSIDLSQISYLDTFITSVNQMFANAENLAEINLGDLTFANCTDMTGLFGGTAITSIDVSKFNTSKCKYMGMMFAYTNLETLDLTSFDFSNVEDYTAMFARSLKLRELKAYSGIAGLETQMLFAGIETDGTLYTDNWDNIFATYAPSTWTIKAPSKITIEINSGASYLFYDDAGYQNISKYINKITINGEDVGVSNAPDLPNDSNTAVVYFDEFDENVSLYRLFYKNKYITSINLSRFDTSRVTNMSSMFEYCDALTSLDLSNFDTRNVTSMNFMFSDCSSLTSLNMSSFNTSNVTHMQYMFYDCSKLTSLDVSNFDTSKVCYMGDMFRGCSSLTSLNVSSFDTSNVYDMEYMFAYCSSLTSLDLYNFDTTSVSSMYSMFYKCSKLTSLDLSNFDTSKFTSMYCMFYNCSKLTSLNVSNFNTSNVTTMYSMFCDCSSLTSLDLSSFDTNNVTNMYSMFSRCSSLVSLDLSNFDTSKVTDMSYIFNGCYVLTSLNLSSFDTSNVAYMSYMFYNCKKLTSLDLSNFNTGKVTTMNNMFNYCTSLTSLDLSSFNFSKVTNAGYIFANCTSLTSLTVDTDVTSMSIMYYMFRNITTSGVLYTNSTDNIFAQNIPDTWTVKVPSRMTIEIKSGASYLFYNSTGYSNISKYIKKMTVNGEEVEISNAPNLPNDSNTVVVHFNKFNENISLYYLFYNNKYITSIDLSNFDTSKITSMSEMFSSCSSLTYLNLSNLNTSNVTNMSWMFSNCSKLTSLDVSSFNTNKVKDMERMFYGCSQLKSLDISNFDISSVTSMRLIFSDCSSLTSLTVNTDVTSISSSSNMFYNVTTSGTLYTNSSSNVFAQNKPSTWSISLI